MIDNTLSSQFNNLQRSVALRMEERSAVARVRSVAAGKPVTPDDVSDEHVIAVLSIGMETLTKFIDSKGLMPEYMTFLQKVATSD